MARPSTNSRPRATTAKRMTIWVGIAGFSLILGLLAFDNVRRQANEFAQAGARTVASQASIPNPENQSGNPKQNPDGNGGEPQTADPLKLNPELSAFFHLIEQRQTGAARIRLRKYMRLNPSDGKASFLFGLSYHREQKYGAAIVHYEDALRLSPDYYLTKHFHGWALYYLGELDASRHAFVEFLERQPDEPDSNYALGLIELDEDNLDQAEQRFVRAIELGRGKPKPDAKDLSKAHARLGETYERQGDLEKAKAELVKSTQLFPDHYEAFYKLYRVLTRLGEDDEAQRIHKIYLETKHRIRPGTSFPE